MLWKTQLDFYLFYLVVISLFWGFIVFSNLIQVNRARLLYLLFGALTFSFLLALRSADVGSDSTNYASLVINPGYLKQTMEPIFVFLAYLMRTFGGNEYTFFFSISAIMNVSLVFAFYKIDQDKFQNYFLLFTTSFLFINMNMNILRQGMAIGFGALALAYLMNKQGGKATVFLTLAILSHYSAIILLIFPVFNLITFTRKKIVLFLILISIIYTFKLSTLIEPLTSYSSIVLKLYWYLSWDRLVPFQIKHIYVLLLAFFIIYFVLMDNAVKSKQVRYGERAFLIIFLFIALFREDEFLVDRSTFYFYPLLAVMVFESISLFLVKENKLIVSYGIVFGSLLWLGQSFVQFYSWWVLGNVV